MKVSNRRWKTREVDDFQPRVQLKKQYVAGGIKTNNEDKIKKLAQSFAVSEKFVKKTPATPATPRAPRLQEGEVIKAANIAERNKTVQSY